MIATFKMPFSATITRTARSIGRAASGAVGDDGACRSGRAAPVGWHASSRYARRSWIGVRYEMGRRRSELPCDRAQSLLRRTKPVRSPLDSSREGEGYVGGMRIFEIDRNFPGGIGTRWAS
ncbi:hypothetical protein ES707_00987 [subsurface metagenome]